MSDTKPRETPSLNLEVFASCFTDGHITRGGIESCIELAEREVFGRPVAVRALLDAAGNLERAAEHVRAIARERELAA